MYVVKDFEVNWDVLVPTIIGGFDYLIHSSISRLPSGEYLSVETMTPGSTTRNVYPDLPTTIDFMDQHIRKLFRK